MTWPHLAISEATDYKEETTMSEKKRRPAVSPQIRPITELRNTIEISELCHQVEEPVFITKNGYGDLVIMTIETYNRIVGNPQREQDGPSL